MTIPKSNPSEWQAISVLNWPEQFPYAPQVRFRIWHDDESLHIIYDVKEKTTKAEQTILGQPVYMDSCVECFIQPEPQTDPHYYNFEWNAAGKLAMACRTCRQDPENAPEEVLKSVDVNPSLGYAPFAEKPVDAWTLEVRIPVSAFFHSSVRSLSGRKMKMNFYKCGDGLKDLHYITWAPVKTENPDYHRPEFFQEVEFE